ncbi:MAG: Hsp70 family protein [Verrucomicrobiota bacterium]
MAGSRDGEDKNAKEKVETRNNADNLAYQAEKLVTDNGDKISDENKTKIEASVKEVREAIEADDTEKMKSSQEALSTLMATVSQELYQQAAENVESSGAEAGPDPSASDAEPKKADADVIDADFEEVDKNEKK